MKILSASEKLTRGRANARTNGMPREPRIYYRKPFNRQVATSAAVAPKIGSDLHPFLTHHRRGQETLLKTMRAQPPHFFDAVTMEQSVLLRRKIIVTTYATVIYQIEWMQ